jgi:hypothetical protein
VPASTTRRQPLPASWVNACDVLSKKAKQLANLKADERYPLHRGLLTRSLGDLISARDTLNALIDDLQEANQ